MIRLLIWYVPVFVYLLDTSSQICIKIERNVIVFHNKILEISTSVYCIIELQILLFVSKYEILLKINVLLSINMDEDSNYNKILKIMSMFLF